MVPKKLISIALIIVLVASLNLFIFGKIAPIYFWIIAGIIGFIAFKVIPRIK